MQELRTLIAHWQFREQWNFDSIPGPEEFGAYADAVFAAASGDGVIAPEERAWITGYFASLGMPDEGIARFRSADPAVMGPDLRHHLQAFLDSPAGPFNRGLVYDCIRAASADGTFRIEESRQVHEIAEVLGIGDSVTTEIEEICRTQEQMKSAKLRLFYPDGIFYADPPPARTVAAVPSARELIAAWHFEEEWGFLQVPTGIEFATYAESVLAAASADGVLAPEERSWIVGYFACIGAPDSLLEHLDTASPSDVGPRLKEHLASVFRDCGGFVQPRPNL